MYIHYNQGCERGTKETGQQNSQRRLTCDQRSAGVSIQGFMSSSYCSICLPRKPAKFQTSSLPSHPCSRIRPCSATTLPIGSPPAMIGANKCGQSFRIVFADLIRAAVAFQHRLAIFHAVFRRLPIGLSKYSFLDPPATAINVSRSDMIVM